MALLFGQLLVVLLVVQLGGGQLGQFRGQRRQLDAKAAGDAPRRLGGADEDANVGGEERGQVGRRVANVPVV